MVAAVLTGMVPYSLLNTPAPVSFALQQVGIYWGSALVSVGALLGITSVLLVLLFGQSRIFFAMSRDGLLPPVFKEMHPKFRTPVKVTIFIGVVTALIASLLPLQDIAQLVNVGTLAAFIIVSAGVIVLRYKRPELERPFKCPLVPFVPVVCMIACTILILSLPTLTHIRFVVWLFIGFLVYLVYSSKHSQLQAEISDVRIPGPVVSPAGQSPDLNNLPPASENWNSFPACKTKKHPVQRMKPCQVYYPVLQTLILFSQ